MSVLERVNAVPLPLDSRPPAAVAATAAPAPTPCTIGLVAHVGMQNLGDEIMFAATLHHYRTSVPGARFVAFTMNAADTATRYGLEEVYPIRPAASAPAEPARGRFAAYARTITGLARAIVHEMRFAVRSLRRLRGVDVLVVPGSSQFIDAYGGSWGFPLALLRWAALARLARTPLCFISLGAEELQHPLSRWMVRRTVQLARAITLRDEVSRERLIAQGVRRALPLAPDLSLAYPWSVPGDVRRVAGSGTVGINPIPYYHRVFWRAVDEARYQRYLGAMVDLAAELLACGHRLVLYGTTQWADRVPAEDMQTALVARLGPDVGARIAMPEVHTLEDLRAVLAGVDWVVASRYHGVATALLMRRPVVGIAYERKTADLMASFGLGDYAVAIDEIEGAPLAALLARAQANGEAIRAALDARVRRGSAEVRAQLDAVLAAYGTTRVEA